MDVTIILIYILFALFGILLIWIIILELRLRKFFSGSDTKSLEATIKKVYEQNSNLIETQKEINIHLEKMDVKIRRSVRDIKTIRFNPFAEEGGGKQSFATALINDNGDGVILSSLYSRDRMSIFAKPIKNNKSEFELTQEEKEVLEQNG